MTCQKEDGFKVLFEGKIYLMQSKNVHVSVCQSSKSVGEKTTNTGLPMDILEEEELERISGLLQRDNLVRGLGIVEHVYRLLHCTPGTVGVLQAEPKPQPLSLVSMASWQSNFQLSHQKIIN